MMETLRLDPSVRWSTYIDLSEDQEICGKKFITTNVYCIHFVALHRNPNEW